MTKFDNLVSLLQENAKKVPNTNEPGILRTGFGWVDETGLITKTLSYDQLDQQARRIAASLQKLSGKGERAVLLYPSGLEFISAFFGCLYAGVVAIPVCAAPLRNQFSRIDTIVTECEPKFILTTEKLHKKITSKLQNPFLKTVISTQKQHFIVTDDVTALEEATSYTPLEHSPEDFAYIQYTSGSTAFSKAVWITHGNAIYQARVISDRCAPGPKNPATISVPVERDPPQLGICWLPHYHDMGLVGHIFAPLYSGVLPVLFQSPFAFLRHPDRFLKTVTRHQVTHIAMPNFGYELCVKKTAAEDLSKLKLGQIQVALTAAENILYGTLESFAKKFEPSGFKMEMFYPCYGLAEATLLVTAGKRAGAPEVRHVTQELADRNKLHYEGKSKSQPLPIIGCGKKLDEVELIIVDPELRVPCECYTVGEIWVRGPNVAKGYYGQPEKTSQIFQARAEQNSNAYLRTGDMGFVDENGELFLVGRLKDIITLQGRAVYPQDIEWTVENLPIGARSGSSAVFSVSNSTPVETKAQTPDGQEPVPVKPNEQIVVMVELKGSHTEDTLKTVERKIRDAVREDHGIDLHDVILLPERTIPKTTSGKVMRFACRYNYLNSSFPVINEYQNIKKADDPTVIVGMACRLPKADSADEFWQNLTNGVDCVSRVPDDRWNADAFYDADTDKPGKMPTDQGGFINNVEQFDALFFSISGREAEVMDPQQRLMLEVTYEALEDAGIPMEQIKGTHTGVFMGSCFSDYHKIQCTDIEKIRPYVQTGSAQSVLANRISYFFDLKGPSFSVDTACSSSLVALHLADKSLKSGDCKTAIVGGCSVNLLPEMFVAFAKLHMLSPDGRCKSFDADGNGYVRAEGVCALVLKTLSQAKKDNDPIYAILRGSGINQDGHTPGLTFPGREAQQALLEEVYSKAGLSPQDIQYIEAHGTGTKVGDPVEANAIGSVLGRNRTAENPLLIGSVKSNIGHTEGASGLVGLIKVLLSMKHEMIPSNLHFKTPNPDIDFEQMRLAVVSKPHPWPVGQRLRRAGVNSFGFGGTNAHAVVEEYKQQSHKRNDVERYYPFSISAHSKKAIDELNAKLQGFLQGAENINLKDLSYTLMTRRTHHNNRVSVVAKTVSELIDELKLAKPAKVKREQLPLRVAFIFTGQGAQWHAMGRQLMNEEPVFKESLLRCDSVIRKHLNWSLLEELSRDEASSRIHQPDISQPACCALQIALVDLWKSWGIVPAAVLGHSSGEHGAVYASGALDLEDAIMASAYRGIAMQQSSENGKMAAIGLSEKEALEFIAPYSGRVGIAAVNSPTSITISGDGEAIDEIDQKLKSKDVFSRVLQVKRAFHSHHMTAVAPKLKELLQNIHPKASTIPMISSVTGALCDGTDVSAQYWVDNMVGTVRFLDAVKVAVETQNIHAFVEIGPHPALQGPTRQCLAVLGAADKPVLPSLARNANEHQRIINTLVTLHNLGAEADWSNLCGSKAKTIQGLPSFPWQHQKFWFESEVSIRNRFRESAHELLGHRLPHPHGAWENELLLTNVPYLRDHKVQGNVVFPAAGYCALGVAVAPEGLPLALEEMTFKRPIMFDPPEAAVKVQVVLNKDVGGDKTGFSIYFQDGKQFVEVSTGVLNKSDAIAENSTSIADIQARCTSTISQDEIYNLFGEAGLEYGPYFQGIKNLARGEKEAIGEVIPKNECGEALAYLLHPTLLDAAFQCLLGAVSNLSASYLPTSIKSLLVFGPCHKSDGYWVHAVAKELNDRVLSGDIYIYSKQGALLAKVDTLQCNSIGRKASSTAEDTTNWSESIFEVNWKSDISLLSQSNIRQIVSICETPLDREADQIATMYLQRALSELKKSGTAVDEKHKKLFDWASGYLADKPETSASVTEGNLESTIMDRVGQSLLGIFKGECDPLSVVFADSLLHNIYEKGQTFIAANGVVKQILSLIRHKNTSLKVLEIGAGTGGTTTHVLPILGKYFESYTYTDISPSFFESAKTKFSPWLDKLKFSVLNIEKDPITQGFEAESYDLIIATDVLHATKNIKETLSRVRQLLAPGGSLVLNELTNTPIWVQTLFGTLSGWWAFEDPDLRTLGPTISSAGWEKILYETNFDKVLSVPDRPEAIHTVFMASRVLPDLPRLQWDVLSSSSSPLAQGVTAALGNQSRIVSPADSLGKNVIYLVEEESNDFYKGVSQEPFDVVKKVIHSAENVLWVIRGGLLDYPTPEQAPLAGFVRTLLNEYPALRSITVDIGSSSTLDESIQAIVTTVDREINAETEVAFRKSIAYVPRLAPKIVEPPKKSLGEMTLSEIPVQLEVGTPGLLSTLHWREVKNTTPLAKNEVEISVRATGLNFKDIMLAMGMLGEEAVVGGFCTSNLGIECSGIITALGEDAAKEYKIGDRVVSVAKNCFSSRVRTISSLAVQLPDHITFEEAASIPATFLTAMYALNYLGRLSAGETVLIHAAAGGVGLAAIQLCRLAGAEVYATVGTEDKRRYLREEMQVPDDHIMSSRNLDFVEQIMQKTNGRGVDIVLNSLAGEALKKSMTILAPFGRFLEIGKRDIYGNSKLDMLPFGQNISFFAIDLDRLNGQKPHLGGKLFRELIGMFANRSLKPLPLNVYSYANVEQAFRFMQQGKHIGKVVLSLDTQVKAEVLPSETLFRKDRSYILVGGLGGFGRAVAKWMVSKGAGHLVFLSRSGASTPEAKELVGQLESSGAKVSVFAGDVSDEAFIERVVAETKKTSPLAGIMQAAMVLEDALVDGMSVECLNKVLAPKVKGTYNLHKATMGESSLDFFISFSSVSSIVGNLSQSNYAAANAYLDALAHWRISNGLPATSINWGAIGDVGYVATRKDLQQNMAKRGIKTLPINEALSALAYAVTNPKSVPQFVAAPMIWTIAGKTLSALNLSKFGFVRREDVQSQSQTQSSSGSGSQVGQKLAAANTPEEKTAVVLEAICEKLASMLNVPQDQVEPDNRMSDLGVDSLMAVEMKNWISAELKATNISVLDLTGSKSIADIAQKIGKDLATSSTLPAAIVSPRGHGTHATGGLFRGLHFPENPKYRLVCFPHLGGNSLSYKEWPSTFADAEIWAYEPTDLYKDWEALIAALTGEQLLQETTLPIFLYGHSLGGLIAYEVGYALEQKGKSNVKRLVIGACGSPRFPNDLVKLGTEWSDSLVESVSAEQLMTILLSGGLVDNTNSPEIVRASILLGRRYSTWTKTQGLTRAVASPMHTVIAAEDRVVGDIERVRDWKDFTTSTFAVHTLGEGSNHLFNTQNPAVFSSELSVAFAI